MTGVELIGYAAASLTTASLVPQARLLYRTRNTSGVSLGMYSAFTVGVALWLAYGVLLSAWPVILANVVTLALAVTILAMKLRYGGVPAPGVSARRKATRSARSLPRTAKGSANTSRTPCARGSPAGVPPAA